MIRTEMTTDVGRPTDEVFAYVVDFTNLPEYDRRVESAAKTSDGEIGAGSTWTHRRIQGRRRFDAPIKLVEVTPLSRFVMVSGSKGFDVRSTMTFEPKGTRGTRITEVLEMRLSGFIRLFEPLIRRQVPGRGREVNQRLKEVLEARPLQDPGSDGMPFQDSGS